MRAAGVRSCAGLNAAKPFTPSLNQIRNCKSDCVVKTATGIAVMFASVVSPKTTVSSPLLTSTLTAAAGSLPLTLVPSLLQ